MTAPVCPLNSRSRVINACTTSQPKTVNQTATTTHAKRPSDFGRMSPRTGPGSTCWPMRHSGTGGQPTPARNSSRESGGLAHSMTITRAVRCRIDAGCFESARNRRSKAGRIFGKPQGRLREALHIVGRKIAASARSWRFSEARHQRAAARNATSVRHQPDAVGRDSAVLGLGRRAARLSQAQRCSAASITIGTTRSPTERVPDRTTGSAPLGWLETVWHCRATPTADDHRQHS